jgi:hypothetical protein
MRESAWSMGTSIVLSLNPLDPKICAPLDDMALSGRPARHSGRRQLIEDPITCPSCKPFETQDFQSKNSGTTGFCRRPPPITMEEALVGVSVEKRGSGSMKICSFRSGYRQPRHGPQQERILAVSDVLCDRRGVKQGDGYLVSTLK